MAIIRSLYIGPWNGPTRERYFELPADPEVVHVAASDSGVRIWLACADREQLYHTSIMIVRDNVRYPDGWIHLGSFLAPDGYVMHVVACPMQVERRRHPGGN